MTSEKAKVKTFDVVHFVADNAGLSIFEAIEKAYNMGVSEQKAILDKIRAEVNEYESRQLTLAIGVDDLEKGKQIAIEYVLAILDKYKMESAR